ncbi:MAG: AAA family ATPase [Candidatus Jettenia sp.]|nr:AAA family ATPase [Candidatus Jettenia sp.]
MKVIGAVGLNGSGKDELVNYLSRRCGIPVLSAGDVVRDIAQEEGIAPTRDNLHDISRRYYAQWGNDIFMRKLIEKIEECQWKVVGITGIRTSTDVATLRNHFGQNFILVHVEVSQPSIRYERTRKRGEARDPQTLEEFLIQDKTEEEIFKIGETIHSADVTINNDGTRKDFYRKIEEFLVQRKICDEMQTL